MEEKKEIVDTQEKIDFFDESIKKINEIMILTEEKYLNDVFIVINNSRMLSSKNRM